MINKNKTKTPTFMWSFWRKLILRNWGFTKIYVRLSSFNKWPIRSISLNFRTECTFFGIRIYLSPLEGFFFCYYYLQKTVKLWFWHCYFPCWMAIFPHLPPMEYTYYKHSFIYNLQMLTANLLKQGYRYYGFQKAVSKLNHLRSGLVGKYTVSMKTLIQ